MIMARLLDRCYNCKTYRQNMLCYYKLLMLMMMMMMTTFQASRIGTMTSDEEENKHFIDFYQQQHLILLQAIAQIKFCKQNMKNKGRKIFFSKNFLSLITFIQFGFVFAHTGEQPELQNRREGKIFIHYSSEEDELNQKKPKQLDKNYIIDCHDICL